MAQPVITAPPAPARQRATRLLVSVRSAHEARLALAGGAAVIDAKEPRAGALGALPVDVVAAIVRAVDGRVPVSATTGDLPLDPALLAPALAAMAATGVDYVKIGLFGTTDLTRLDCCLAHPLARAARGRDGRAVARIAVLMADQGGIDWPLRALAAGGFVGVMLDTAAKGAGGLRQAVDAQQLRSFVLQAQTLGLLVGLAGSLGTADILPLQALEPDFLGFRTAVCGAMGRGGDLDPLRLATVEAALRSRYGLSALGPTVAQAR